MMDRVNTIFKNSDFYIQAQTHMVRFFYFRYSTGYVRDCNSYAEAEKFWEAGNNSVGIYPICISDKSDIIKINDQFKGKTERLAKIMNEAKQDN